MSISTRVEISLQKRLQENYYKNKTAFINYYNISNNYTYLIYSDKAIALYNNK